MIIGIVPHEADILTYPIVRHLLNTQPPSEISKCMSLQ